MSMTTQQVADRLIELYNQGKAVQAEEELYADDVVSYEQDPSRNAHGKAAVMEKTKQAFGSIEEVYKSLAGLPLVNGNTFLIEFEMDVKFKGAERMHMKEYGFYKLNADGKVAEEYFFA